MNTGTKVKLSDAYLKDHTRLFKTPDKNANDTGTIIDVFKDVFCLVQFGTDRRYFHRANLTEIE